MRQLADNSALLVAILAPSLAGIFMLRTEIVHLLIAAPFQAVTLAILPLSVLAGAIRNLRAHFGDQVFLLHSRTRWLMVVASDRCIVTVVCSAICFCRYWGLAGVAGATVRRRWPPQSSVSRSALRGSACTFRSAHLVRIALATIAMAALLRIFPEAPNYRRVWRHMSRPAPPPISQRLPCSTRRRCCGCSAPASSIREHERIGHDGATPFWLFSNARAIANQSGFFCIDESNGSGRGSRCASGFFFFAASV